MHRSPIDLQYYVSRAGDQVFSPPFVLDEMNMMLFVLRADKAKLDKLLDRELNEPWQQAFASSGVRHHYAASGDWIVFVLSEVQELYPEVFKRYRSSGNDDQKEIELAALSRLLRLGDRVDVKALANASASQRELIAMIPIEDEGTADGDTRLWYMPIVLNDCPPAVLAGREVFGYPKIIATFVGETAGEPWARLLDGDGHRAWDTYLIQALGPVEKEDKITLDYVPALEIHADELLPPAPAHDEPTQRLIEEADARIHKQIEFLFLRQFRDPEYPDRASYQAAVSGLVTAATGQQLEVPKADDDPQRYTLRFRLDAGSFFQVIEELGVVDHQEGSEAGDRVTPLAVYTLHDQELIVTRGSVKWDKP